MRLDEIKSGALMEMSYDRKKVEQIVTALEDPINTHLVKLLALDAPPRRRERWRQELRAWYRKIGSLRLKPNRARPSAGWLFEMLFTEPFGGAEDENVSGIVALHAGQYQPATAKTAADVVSALRAFHEKATARLERGEDVEELLAGL